MTNAAQHRTKVYDMVKRVIGRDLTETEHEDLRAAMLAYVNDQVVPTKLSHDNLSKKIKAIGASYFDLQRKRGTPESNLKELTEVLKEIK